MRFTKYGQSMAKVEPAMPNPKGLTGASLHMAACGFDTGLSVVLTGTANGKRVRKTAKSVYGAYAVMHAVWGVSNAWHVRPDGTRRLLIQR